MLTENYKDFTYLNLVFTVALTMVAAVLPIYLREVGYSAIQQGVMFALFPVSIVLFLPLLGQLADRMGKRTVLVFAIVAEMIALALYFFAGSGLQVMLARFLDGLAASTLTIITLAKVEDSIKKRRGVKSGKYLSIAFLGTLLAPPVAIFLAGKLFLRFPILLSMFMLMVMLCLLFNKREMHFSRIRRSDLNYVHEIRYFLSFRQLKGMALLGMAAHFGKAFSAVYLPLFIIEKLELHMNFFGVALFVFGVTHLLQAQFGWLSDRYSPSRMITLGGAIAILGYFTIGISSGFVQLAIGLFIIGVGNAAWNVSAWHLMSNVGEEIKQEGMVASTYMGLAKLGSIAGFLISGLIFTKLSFQWLAIVNGALLLTVHSIAFRLIRNHKLRAI